MTPSTYDALDAEGQALARAQWRLRLQSKDDGTDLRAELGPTWVEADAHGAVVTCDGVQELPSTDRVELEAHE